MEEEDKEFSLENTALGKVYLSFDAVHEAFASPLAGINSVNREIDLFASKVNLLSATLSSEYLSTGIAQISNSFGQLTPLKIEVPSFDIPSHVFDPITKASATISKLLEPTVALELSRGFENVQVWLTEYESTTKILKTSFDGILGGVITTPALSGTTYHLNSGILKLHELGSLDGELINQFSIQDNLSKVAELNLFAEKSLAGTAIAQLGGVIGLSPELQQSISASLNLVTTSYNDVFKTFEGSPGLILDFNPTLLRDIPTQMFTTSNFLESITIDEQEEVQEEELKTEIIYENEIGLSYHLRRFDNDLYQMWRGAIEALDSRNSDRVRHFSVSIRELITHVLHTLAPNDEVKKWTNNPEHYHDKKPTRKARILYICREISTSNFNKFVEADVNSMIEFVNLFQEGTHAKRPTFTEKQLIAMRTKAESTLKFLLEIANG